MLELAASSRRRCDVRCEQVSEKILLLDAEAKELRLAAAAADDRAEVLAREKVQVMTLAEELRADVANKMALLDEFEARFARQYR
jgi:centrosomal protein CEP290